MKICLVQTNAVKGDIQANIALHKQWIALAVADGVEMIIFPELSLTGYEPTMAKMLAIEPDDHRLAEFQLIADRDRVLIGVGVPLRQGEGVCIGMVIFRPNQPPQRYTKQYLHPDELPFFTSGEQSDGFIGNIALAICYELSIPAHAEHAFVQGASIYLASVAKTAAGVANAAQRLATIASQYKMSVLMVNCVGECDGVVCAGKSAIWNNKGMLVNQLNDTDEGYLIFDSDG